MPYKNLSINWPSKNSLANKQDYQCHESCCDIIKHDAPMVGEAFFYVFYRPGFYYIKKTKKHESIYYFWDIRTKN